MPGIFWRHPYPFSSSSSSFVVVRFPGGTSEIPVTFFLRSSLFHLAERLDPQPRTKDDVEDENDNPEDENGNEKEVSDPWPEVAKKT
jgi:hypothetical protein